MDNHHEVRISANGGTAKYFVPITLRSKINLPWNGCMLYGILKIVLYELSSSFIFII